MLYSPTILSGPFNSFQCNEIDPGDRALVECYPGEGDPHPLSSSTIDPPIETVSPKNPLSQAPTWRPTWAPSLGKSPGG